ncbi:DUF4349 domain-containing protein [Luteimonas sp. 3794]|uniref:DUF4349 domain-containing protein n=1 Tax=Luteimonas sp. 3794 TaxID=2817730 RepID=UPI002858A168|nr:DUF4349 domain-containing protein [Luteimonas sp. 3794]MDR6990200.1 hypothetical protein [Luteimonas sp. 3794]
MHEFRRAAWLSTCVLMMLMSGCAKQSGGAAEMVSVAAETPQADAASAEDAAAAGTPVDASTQMASGAMAQDAPGRRFVRTADVRFSVDDVYRSVLAIEDLAAGQGGFVVSNRIRSDTQNVRRHNIGDGQLLELTEYTTQGELIVRVPSDRAQAFLRELAQQMTFLDSRDFEARDVQFDLLRQQLADARSEELQQSLAQAVRDEDRLDRKGEAFAARAQALAARDDARVAQREVEDRIAFATLSLSLYQPAQVRRSERADPDAAFAQHRPGFFARIGQALRGGWQGVLDLTVALVAIWPLWVFVIAAVLSARAWMHLRTRKQG